jgi:hypothetical protein
MMKRGLALAALVTTLAGCGSGSDYSLAVSGDDGGTQTFGADGGGVTGLDASIEENRIAVQVITLTCSGPCADVQAIATGGTPPYTYVWADGTSGPTRHVCPDADTGYKVTVTDTGSSGEFTRAAQTATATLTAKVIACPDGGSRVADAGPIADDASVSGCGAQNTVCWASWAGYSVGTPGSGTASIATPSGTIDVAYSGEVAIQTTVGAGINWFTPVSTYTCATVTDPPASPGSIFQVGGTTLVDTLTFSRPVTNPVFAIASLGDSIADELGTYDFGSYREPFTVLKYGPGSMAGPGTLTDVDGGLVGNDGDGLVQLLGTFQTIRWTDPTAESGGGHAFTIGVPAQ